MVVATLVGDMVLFLCVVVIYRRGPQRHVLFLHTVVRCLVDCSDMVVRASWTVTQQ
jgi:hypothetical protein